MPGKFEPRQRICGKRIDDEHACDRHRAINKAVQDRSAEVFEHREKFAVRGKPFRRMEGRQKGFEGVHVRIDLRMRFHAVHDHPENREEKEHAQHNEKKIKRALRGNRFRRDRLFTFLNDRFHSSSPTYTVLSFSRNFLLVSAIAAMNTV